MMEKSTWKEKDYGCSESQGGLNPRFQYGQWIGLVNTVG